MSRKERRAPPRRGQHPPAKSTPAAAPPNPFIADALRLAIGHHQAGQLGEAEQLYRTVLASDPFQMDALHLLGVIALQVGRHNEAVELIGRALVQDDERAPFHHNLALAYRALGRRDDAATHFRRATALQPDYVEAHVNLGNVLRELGRPAEALASYEQAATLRPEAAEIHYNIGNLLADHNRLEEAVQRYERALAAKPDYAAALNNLGTALMALGQTQRAAECLQRATAAQPDFLEAHANLGAVLMTLGKAGDAAAQYERVVALKPDYADAHNKLAVALMAQNKPRLALEHLQRALALKPDFPDAVDNLVKLLVAEGQVGQALRLAARTVLAKENEETKARFVHCLIHTDPLPAEFADLADLVAIAITEGWARPSDLSPAACRLLKHHRLIAAAIARVAAAWPQHPSIEELFGPDGFPTVARDRLLRALLVESRVCDAALERLLTVLRSRILEWARRNPDPLDDDVLAFCCALARQCFSNEYVFAYADDEFQNARVLRHSLMAALQSDEPVPPLWIAAVAAYFPLHALGQSPALLAKLWPTPVNEIVAQQVRAPDNERQLRYSIPRLTSIDDETSLAVQRRHEDYAYPRWSKVAQARASTTVGAHLRALFPAAAIDDLDHENGVDVLVAGCGTGEDAIETATHVAGARVLAVDVSLTSLAYAARKVRERGIAAIEFAQADLLQLMSLGRSFDVIIAAGLLDHLADPAQGWGILGSLLRPGGAFYVGLTSPLARSDVVKARHILAARGFREMIEDIRRCRQFLIDLGADAPGGKVATMDQFFSMSACRDLLFSGRETFLTLSEINYLLIEQDLVPIGLHVDPATRSRYRRMFPNDRTMTDLEQWNRFERDHPNTFAGGYRLWARKRPEPAPLRGARR